MTWVAELSPAGVRFEIAAGETVLDAALRQGVGLDYGCRHGNCSSCKYRLADGEIDCGAASIYSLTEAEREDGYGLLCCARPLSDLVIESSARPDPRAAPVLSPRTLAGRIADARPLAGRLWHLAVELGQPLAFYPGQYVELSPDGDTLWRPYSIASAPSSGCRLEFVIKAVPGGAFSAGLAAWPAGTPMHVRGPYGASYLRAGDAPVLLCATGAGIAPILSILRHAAAAGDRRRYTFHYGARTAADLPHRETLAALLTGLDGGLDFRPSLSQPDARWDGRRGRITRAIQREVADASPCDAYLCGAPAMCDAVGALLEAKGIRGGALFYDRFHAAG